MFYLPKDLEHDRGFARTGISDDLHVLRLGPLRYADHCLHLVGLDTYSVSSDPAVELLRRHHLGLLVVVRTSDPCVVGDPCRSQTGAG